jgi:hypothetical protein
MEEMQLASSKQNYLKLFKRLKEFPENFSKSFDLLSRRGVLMIFNLKQFNQNIRIPYREIVYN